MTTTDYPTPESPVIERVRERFGDDLDGFQYRVVEALTGLADSDGCFHPTEVQLAEASDLGSSLAEQCRQQLTRKGIIARRDDGQPGYWFADEFWWGDLAEPHEDVETESDPPDESAPAETVEVPLEHDPAELPEWNPKTSRWAWEAELVRCRNVSEVALRVGVALSLKCHSETGDVYRPGKRLAEDIGRSRGQAEEGRKVLAGQGWITPNGWNRYGCKVWRLTIPPCGCGKHSDGVSGVSGHTP